MIFNSLKRDFYGGDQISKIYLKMVYSCTCDPGMVFCIYIDMKQT